MENCLFWTPSSGASKRHMFLRKGSYEIINIAFYYNEVGRINSDTHTSMPTIKKRAAYVYHNLEKKTFFYFIQSPAFYIVIIVHIVVDVAQVSFTFHPRMFDNNRKKTVNKKVPTKLLFVSIIFFSVHKMRLDA